MAHLDVSMGGRAAEELIFGPQKITTGAGGDFQGATQMALAMAAAWGMSGTKEYPRGIAAFDKKVSRKTVAECENEVRDLLQVNVECVTSC
jgi:ATP-dependent Zn protease